MSELVTVKTKILCMVVENNNIKYKPQEEMLLYKMATLTHTHVCMHAYTPHTSTHTHIELHRDIHRLYLSNLKC